MHWPRRAKNDAHIDGSSILLAQISCNLAARS